MGELGETRHQLHRSPTIPLFHNPTATNNFDTLILQGTRPQIEDENSPFLHGYCVDCTLHYLQYKYHQPRLHSVPMLSRHPTIVLLKPPRGCAPDRLDGSCSDEDILSSLTLHHFPKTLFPVVRSTNNIRRPRLTYPHIHPFQLIHLLTARQYITVPASMIVAR
jgi:hypothetical protein